MSLLDKLGLGPAGRVEWGRCKDVGWCYLLLVDLDSPAFDGQGVYVVWSKGKRPAPGNTVAVGHGDIRGGLDRLRRDNEVLKRQDLFFTAARLPEALQPGAHAFLDKALRPAMGQRPKAKPVKINLPG